MSSVGTNRFLGPLLGIGGLAILTAPAIVIGRADLTASLRALFLATGGGVALLLLGFTLREIASAIGHAAGRSGPPEEIDRSAYLWGAAARNAWLLGALGATTELVRHVCSGFTSLGAFVAGLGDVAVPTTFGVGLAALFAVPALRLSGRLGDSPPTMARASNGTGPAYRWEHLPAYGLLGLLLAWPLLSPGSGPRFEPAEWLLHWPAVLVVTGGGLALAMYLGFPRSSDALSIGLAAAGLIAALLGLTQALRGFAGVSIEAVSQGLTFMVSACFAALVGLAAFAMPFHDRAYRPGDAGAGRAAGRAACYGFPLVALACLAIMALLVLVPMEKAPHSDDPTNPAGGSETSRPG